MTASPSYRLVAPDPTRLAAPRLDTDQQRVVDHPGGPVLVLAGPGTGKTTTLVEAIVDRIENRGADPASVLALTFSRRAAEQLRDRVTARLGRTLSTGLSSTFHSFAYGLVRRHAPAELYAAPLRLLSAPEQDVVLQQLLTHEAESVRWPPHLAAAVGTRGFAREVSAVLARARERGLGPGELVELGRTHDRQEYVACGLFLEQYLDVLDAESAIDYPDLIARAVIEADRHRLELRTQIQHVFVDEYQDTDPSQVQLLQILAGDGRDLTVVGDPHQSIYGFRGADVRGILDFPGSFRDAAGEKAPTVVLGTTRRFGPHLLLAAQRVARRLPLTGSIEQHAREAFLSPTAHDPTGEGATGNGKVEVFTFGTDRAEAEHLADLLRRAHLEDGVGWAEMAVLVRSGRASIPGLRRSLGAAGVPVEVASDDTPLVREPAVLPLLDAVRAVVNLDNDDPDTAGYLDTDRVHALLLSPIGRLDATEVRALARALREQDKRQQDKRAGPARSSAELVRAAVLEPAILDGLGSGKAVGKVRALAGLLVAARTGLDDGGTVEEVLWGLWQGTDWPRRLRAATDRGGAAARRAHRDLDAIGALFETAARAEEQRGHTSVQSFLDTLTAQQIPADTLVDRGVRGSAVRLLTAHRAKGLQWRLVVVAHVQEEVWPDLRRRTTLLHADDVDHGQLRPPVTARELLAEERRLFYVAATRARERLVVTAVRSPDDEGEQPSRFLPELGVDVHHVEVRPDRPLSLPGLVAELRRVVVDDQRSEVLRDAAALRLAELARLEVDGRRVAPQADPATWWGTRGRTVATAPLRPDDRPLRLSASALTTMTQCQARWFFEREAGGTDRTTQAQGFGNVVHALADRIGRGELPADPAVVGELMEHVDRVWEQIPFRTPWSASQQRVEVEGALTRFIAFHNRPDARTLIATERELTAEVTLPDGERVTLHGFADRLEVDSDGRVVVVDLKTGKYAASDVANNPQLGLYQLAVDHQAVADLTGAAPAGGAELWQLRQQSRGRLKVQDQPPQLPDESGHTQVEQQLMAAARAIRDETFLAMPGAHCDRCAFQRMCPATTSSTVLH